jgi:hypothetical protein
VANTAGRLLIGRLYAHFYTYYPCSLLAEPHKLLPYLLQPETTNLAPDILSVYIQAVTKIFGYWAAQLAQRWVDDDLPQVKSVVDMIMTRVNDFVSSPHVEVQERVGVFNLNVYIMTNYGIHVGGQHTSAVHIHSG